jgi:hypothetical protein
MNIGEDAQIDNTCSKYYQREPSNSLPLGKDIPAIGQVIYNVGLTLYRNKF